MSQNDYYVYVYIDPRDFTEFYYGKGIGNRKYAHLKDNSDTEKARIIQEIQNEGLEPIIRVIATGLTQEQAFLIEKTLIWKLGRSLSNISGGMYSENFRPAKTLYKNIPGFDFTNGIYFFNCGDSGDVVRKWEDSRQFRFLTAGGGKKYSDAIRTFEIGDYACVYLSKHGYVGVCKILTTAVPAREFLIDGQPLFSKKTLGDYRRADQPEEFSEYMVQVEWLATVEREKAFFQKGKKLFTPISVKASMWNQQETLQRVGEHFKVDIPKLLDDEGSISTDGD